MYKATVSERELKFISWINADTQIVMCSVTQGSGDVVNQPTTTTQLPSISSQRQAPQASIRASSAGAGFAILEHQGGEDLILSDSKIIIEQGTSRATFESVSQNKEKFIAGDKLTITPSSITVNGKTISPGKIIINYTGNAIGEITITMIDLIGGQQLANARIGIRGGSFFLEP